jgi:DNA-binding response OmpR family regulator
MGGDLQILRERIEVLEFELAEALRSDAVAPLQLRYGLTRQQAALLAFLLDGRVHTYDGAAVAIGSVTHCSKNSINVLISGIRRKLPWVRIVSVRMTGHYLAPESIARIKAEIAEQ